MMKTIWAIAASASIVYGLALITVGGIHGVAYIFAALAFKSLAEAVA